MSYARVLVRAACSAAVFSLVAASTASAQDATLPANKCLAGKLKAVGKSVAARGKCAGKDVASGVADPACTQKAREKFVGGPDAADGAFGKLEAKHAMGTDDACLTFLDEDTLDTRITEFVASIAPLTGSAAGDCDGAKIQCVAKYVAAVEKCDGAAATKGASNAECVAKALAKLADETKGCLAKAAAASGCTNEGRQADELAAAADAFARATRCRLSPATGCACPAYPFAGDYDALSTGAPGTSSLFYDWRSRGAVTAVQNQGDCVSDGAFSVTGFVEGKYALSHGTLANLSEQQIVDCMPSAATQGCAGISPPLALAYLATASACSESSYPYTARDGTCKTCSPVVPGSAVQFERVPQDEAALRGALARGPVAAVIRGGVWLDEYVEDSIAAPDCDDCSEGILRPYVAVLIVGYGEDAGVPYWQVKLSRGTDVGTGGYIRLRAGSNYCGIADFALSAP